MCSRPAASSANGWPTCSDPGAPGRAPHEARCVTRDEFEQLVCQWLDQPDCAELTRCLRDAIAHDPELAHVRDGWTRFETRLHDRLPAMPPVRWDVLRQRIVHAIEPLSATPPAGQSDPGAPRHSRPRA